LPARLRGVSPKEWADISNPGLNAIVGVRDAAIESGLAHLSQRAVASGRALAIDFGLMAAALILTIAVFVISRNRISQPLTRIAHSLREMSGGKLDLELPRAKCNDEIGAICDALAMFREQSLRVAEVERDPAPGTSRRAPLLSRRQQCATWLTNSRRRSARSSTPFPQRQPILRVQPVP
jgi:HAMP domain-containing protein